MRARKFRDARDIILVDALGLVSAVVVHPANIQDRDGAKLLLAGLANTFLRLRHIWADGGYAGQLIQWVRNLRGDFALSSSRS